MVDFGIFFVEFCCLPLQKSSQTCLRDYQILVFSIMVVFVIKMKGKADISSQFKTIKIYEPLLFETEATLTVNYDKQIYPSGQISLKRFFLDINLNFMYEPVKYYFRMNSLLDKSILSLACTPLQDTQGCVKSTNAMNMIMFVVGTLS